MLVSDALVLTMAEEPLASADRAREVRRLAEEVKPGMETVCAVLRPRPLGSVEGMKVAVFTTAPPALEGLLRGHLEAEWGCRVGLFSPHLADRAALRDDFDRPEMSQVDVVLTEIKAAAIDVVAEEASARGLPVVPLDNIPIEAAGERPGRLKELVVTLAETARQRFESRL